MITTFLAIVAIWLIYQLFVIGTLWKIILFFAGWFGIYIGLLTYLPDARNTVIIFNYPFSWAAVVATGVCFMALLTTRTND